MLIFSPRKRKIGEDTTDGDGPTDKKKIKKELEENQSMKDEIKKQNKIQFKYRDQLEAVSKQDLQILLEHNEQQIPSGVSEVRFLFLNPTLPSNVIFSPCRYLTIFLM